jgi:hypothetical protein
MKLNEGEMVRKKGLRASCVFAVVCAVGVVAGCDSDPTVDLDPTLKIDPADQACTSANECIQTMVKCSCDCGLPINRANGQKYVDAQAAMCRDYQGPLCKMHCSNVVLECRDRVCSAKS